MILLAQRAGGPCLGWLPCTDGHLRPRAGTHRADCRCGFARAGIARLAEPLGTVACAIIVLGMLFPLALNWRKNWLGDFNITATAALALIGGFLLRIVIVFSSEGI